MLHDPHGNGDDRGLIERTNDTLNAAGHFLRILAHAWSAMIYVYTRHSFGQQYFNFWGVSGIFLLSGWAAFTVPPQEMLPHNIMLFSFIALVIYHKLTAPQNFRGYPVHSRYTGWPRACDWFGVSEDAAKGLIEPVLVPFLGGAICLFSPSLGMFIALGGIMCGADRAYIRTQYIERARQIRDAEIEQEYVMDAYDQHFNNGDGR